MEKKKQTMRFNDEEMSLIKNSFAENDDLIRALRKSFLQMPLDAIDQSALSGFTGKEILGVVRKAFLPTLDPNAPIHQLVDLWMTVKVDDKTPEEAMPHLAAREIVIAYLDQQLKVLEGKKPTTDILIEDLVNFKDKNADVSYASLLARNTIISHTEMQLNQFLVLAGLKEETAEAKQKRLEKDSGK